MNTKEERLKAVNTIIREIATAAKQLKGEFGDND